MGSHDERRGSANPHAFGVAQYRVPVALLGAPGARGVVRLSLQDHLKVATNCN
jgi:hypothetical protein